MNTRRLNKPEDWTPHYEIFQTDTLIGVREVVQIAHHCYCDAKVDHPRGEEKYLVELNGGPQCFDHHEGQPGESHLWSSVYMDYAPDICHPDRLE